MREITQMIGHSEGCLQRWGEAYREFWEAGVLAGLQQDVGRGRRRRGRDVGAAVAVLVLLLCQARRGGGLGVVLGVLRFGEGLAAGCLRVAAGVVTVVIHGWREGLRRRRGQAAAVVGGRDLGGRAHDRQEDGQQDQTIQDPQERQDGEDGEKVPARKKRKTQGVTTRLPKTIPEKNNSQEQHVTKYGGRASEFARPLPLL